LVVDAFRCGARGEVFRDEPFDTLAKCIPAVRHGQIWAEGESMRHVVEALSKAMPVHFRDGGGMGRLSKRKTDVARLVARKIALPRL
jgi:DNA-binding NarL/FixJ family response regulator